MWETESEMIAELLREGCIIDINYDGDEPLVTFNMEVLEVKYPEVAEAAKQDQLEQVDESLRELVDKGLLQMSFQESKDGTIEAVYTLTDAGTKYVESMNLTDL